MRALTLALFSYAGLFLTGCATSFPEVDTPPAATDGLAGPALLEQCLEAHGGDLRDSAREVRLSLTGEWSTMIRRIQPLVTDFSYRIDATERHFVQQGRSLVEWSGPAGSKRIDWRPPDIEVAYNTTSSADPDVLASTAMTSEAFRLFHLAPSFLKWRGGEPIRLADEAIDGRNYHRLLFTLEPGFGFSDSDRVVAYIDAGTKRLFRVWITLEGFRTTQGATVDVTYLDYQDVDGHLLPRRLDERVRAPIAIHAHEWTITEAEVIPR
ncbi:MAG: hypothetical protein P8Y52_09085 [Xanthomonadales bacterium]